MEKKRKVIFCIPTITKPLQPCLDALAASVPLLDAAGWDHYTAWSIGCPYISHARAQMVRKALDALADVVVFIDHDMSWEPSALLKLIETEGDCVSGAYRFKDDNEESYMGALMPDIHGIPQVRADGAVKALETEQGAARGYALEAEIAGAIAAGNVVPALVPALKAMVMAQAKADLVDGKYAVTIGDKPAKDYLGAFLDSEEGKAFKAAAVNGGGGAGGGGGSQGGGKTMTKAEYEALDPAAKAEAGAQMVKRELKIIDAAA